MLETEEKVAMRSSNYRTLQATRRAIDLILSSNEVHRNPVPYFAPSDFGSLTDVETRKERTVQAVNDQANRIRAGSHLCLRSARDALAAALELEDLALALSPAHPFATLGAVAQLAHSAGEMAARAGDILQGDRPPPSDGSLTVSKLAGAHVAAAIFPAAVRL